MLPLLSSTLPTLLFTSIVYTLNRFSGSILPSPPKKKNTAPAPVSPAFSQARAAVAVSNALQATCVSHGRAVRCEDQEEVV